MKRIIITAAVFVLMLWAAVPLGACADYSEAESELNGQVNDMLAEYDIGLDCGDLAGMSFSELLAEVRSAVAARASAPLKMLGTLIVVSVFTAVVRSVGGAASPEKAVPQTYDMVCVITAVAVITPQIMAVYRRAEEAVERVGGFIAVFVPVFSGMTIASGGVLSGSLYNAAALGASEVIVGLSASYLMPVLSMTAVLAVTGSVFPGNPSDSIIALLKKVITWGITIVMTLFTGFVTLKCTLAGRADGAATKTAKFIISGTVPIVGGAVSDAYSSVRGSFDVMVSTAGIAGTAAVLLIMLPPVIEILIFRAVIWAGTTAAELFSAASLVKLLKGLDSGLAIAQCVLISYMVIFVVSTAILIQSLP